jgi:hypothetical protein
MWILVLNDMRSPKIEMMTEVARGSTQESLLRLLESERVESYSDGPWGKSFRKGGPLEWCNPPFAHELEHHFIDISAWAERAHREIDATVEGLTRLPEAT